jgi:hypothetical protein
VTQAQDPPKTIGELIDEVERIREDLLRLQRQLEKLEIVDNAVSGGGPSYQSSTSHVKASPRVLNAENSRREKLFMFL